MTASQKFEMVASLGQLLPVVLTLMVMHFSPVPRGVGFRAFVSILIAWIAFVCYTGLVYNPAGVAAGHEAGAHFPEVKFDNNTIASALLGGWLVPAAVIGIYFLGRRSTRAQPIA